MYVRTQYCMTYVRSSVHELKDFVTLVFHGIVTRARNYRLYMGQYPTRFNVPSGIVFVMTIMSQVMESDYKLLTTPY